MRCLYCSKSIKRERINGNYYHQCNFCHVKFTTDITENEIMYITLFHNNKAGNTFHFYLNLKEKTTLFRSISIRRQSIREGVALGFDYLLDITPSNIANFIENRLEKLKVML